MDSQALKAFVSVAELNSFSLAADALHITQPAISKRIRSLEEQLDSRLFDRHNRTLSLTDAGIALLPKARSILQLMDDTELSIRNMHTQVEGTLHLGTSHHIGLHRLPPYLKSFVSNFPEAELNLSFMGSELANKAILQRKVELALTTLETQTPEELEAHVLWHDDMIFVCGNHHVLASNQSPTLKDLNEYLAILPENDTITFRLLAAEFEKHNMTLKSPMPTNYLETIKMMVSVGLGWSLLPKSMVDDSLHTLNIEDIHIDRPLGLVHLKDRTLSNAAKAFISLIKT
jgi:DNA-binding transcriptional LysR family regulator